MLSKRESAERNVLQNGWASCDACAFTKEECECDTLDACVSFSMGWLADNPEESEWTELKIDDLPGDICKAGKYEFQCYVTENNKDDYWITKNISPANALRDAEAGFIYQYRKRQPEKKVVSNEDLAWHYVNKEHKAIFDIDNPRDVYAQIALMIRNASYKAFIAGRESADIPPESTK